MHHEYALTQWPFSHWRRINRLRRVIRWIIHVRQKVSLNLKNGTALILDISFLLQGNCRANKTNITDHFHCES